MEFFFMGMAGYYISFGGNGAELNPKMLFVVAAAAMKHSKTLPVVMASQMSNSSCPGCSPSNPPSCLRLGKAANDDSNA